MTRPLPADSARSWWGWSVTICTNSGLVRPCRVKMPGSFSSTEYGTLNMPGTLRWQGWSSLGPSRTILARGNHPR
jgi:hypothetical protein